jgi:hypothetical protein
MFQKSHQNGHLCHFVGEHPRVHSFSEVGFVPAGTGAGVGQAVGGMRVGEIGEKAVTEPST